MDVELLRHAFPIPGQTAALARRTEAAGWDGLLVADSQNLVGDPYVELALAGVSTGTLRLGTAVTNLVTRDPAVTASSILTVPTEFVEWFAVCGTTDQVVERLVELGQLGLNRLVIVGPDRDADQNAAEEALQRFDTEVLPALRAA